MFILFASTNEIQNANSVTHRGFSDSYTRISCVSLQPARKLHYIYPLKISTAGHQSQFYAKECQVVFCSVGSGSE